MSGHAPKNNFDALRLIASLLVLISHQFALSGRWEPRFIGDHSYGNLGVLIFFSISGYLVSRSWQRDPDLGRFLFKRGLRIFPALAVSIPLTAIIVLLLGLWGFPSNPLHALNGSLWTIPLEIYCYLILLLLVVAIPRYGHVALFILTFTFHFIEFDSNTLRFFSYFGMFFSVGGLLSCYHSLRKRQWIIVLIGAAILVFGKDTALALSLLVPPIVIAIGTRSWPLLKEVGSIGDFSYGIYIYAWPIQQVVVAYLGRDQSYVYLLVSSLPVVLIFAVLSWHLLEKRALALKSRWLVPSHQLR